LGPIPDWYGGPPVLPEIETSDDESLVADILDQLREFSDDKPSGIAARAVIVEVKDQEPKGLAESKGKGTHPSEKGPLYDALRRESSGPSNPGKSHKTPLFLQGPDRFRRADSEKPAGGWFRAMTKSPECVSSGSDDSDSSSDSGSSDTNDPDNPSPSGSDTSDSSSSSSSSVSESCAHNQSNSHRRRSVKAKSGKVRIKNPFTYDGSDDLDTFDRWCYEVDMWCESNKLGKKEAVKYLVWQFMSGKAGRFFMRHIAHNRKEWTTKLVYEGLFDYCFPAQFKLTL
jgi:hypothetical protein